MKLAMALVAFAGIACAAQADIVVVEGTLSPGSIVSTSFSANSGDRLTHSVFNLNGTLDDVDPHGEIRNSGGSIIYNDDGGNGSLMPIMHVTTLETGPHTARFSDLTDFAFTGAHTTTFGFRQVITTAPTAFQMGGNFTQALAESMVFENGAARTRGLLAQSANNWYVFSAQAGVMITAETHSFGEDIDTVIRLYDALGNQLAFNDDSGPSVQSALAYIPTESGLYYIRVEGYDSSVAGDYDLVVSNGIVPTPAAATLLGLGTLAATRRRRAR